MKITLAQLQIYANNFLNTLNKNKINSLEDLSESRTIQVNDNSNEFLKIESKVSEHTGYITTYHLSDTSIIPIQGVINPSAPFSNMKINCETTLILPNYDHITEDNLGNKTQIKMNWGRADFNFLIEELNRIKEYKVK